jgi:hypothetical protein
MTKVQAQTRTAVRVSTASFVVSLSTLMAAYALLL